ncbi:MAG: ABC transporter permease [Acidobacteriia bacterium]|nr:ABC transporter permease [Terriglobia bacterium]
MTVPRRDIRENLWLALDTLRSHKFRAFLTVLGVLIGTATVIGVASIFQGLDREVVELASQFGTRTIFVYKIELSPGHRLTREERLRKPLTYEDGMAIREQCPSVEAVSVMIFGEFTQFGLTPPSVKYKGKEMLDAQFSGVTPEHIYLVNATLSDGRFFNATDETHRRDVAVIGDQVVQRFFEHEDPIGKSILVNGRSFQVIGVFDKFKELLGNNSDDRTVLVPYSTYKKLFPNAKENFISVLASRGKVDQALDELTGLLRRRRNVRISCWCRSPSGHVRLACAKPSAPAAATSPGSSSSKPSP